MYTIYTLFDLQAKSAPQYPALIFNDKIITYKMLSGEVNSTACALKKLGVEQGSRVAVLFPNTPAFVALFYACQKLGAVVIPLNRRLHPDELSDIIQECRCTFFFFDGQYQSLAAAIKIDPDRIMSLPYLEEEGDNGRDLAALIRREDKDWDFFQYPSPEDDALYILSGGTTGRPKVLVHTQQSLLFTVSLRNLGPYGLYKGDVFLNYAPLFHFGGINFMMGILSAGATFILMDSYGTEEIIQQIDRWKVSHLFIIPSSLCTCIKQSPLYGQKDLSSVRCALLGGTIVAEETIRDAFVVFPHPDFCVANGYGTSENGITTMIKLTREMCQNNSPLLKSVGAPTSLSLIRLVNKFGEDVGPGEVGEALGWSPCQFKGYLGRADSFWGGWVITGDLLRQDEDGYLYFVDRKKDMIRTGGENVYCYEVEKVLSQHPAVETCAVFGIPHNQLGEAVIAAVKFKTGLKVSENELIEFCKSHIAGYKKPRRVVFPEVIPQTAVGKTDKKALQKKYAGLFVDQR